VAPSFIQNFGIGGKGDRARVNNFVFDFSAGGRFSGAGVRL
jgi:hypothetical protein